MKKVRATLKIVLFITFSTFGAYATTEDLALVTLNDKNMVELLEGRWQGSSESSGPRGPGSNTISLEIKNGVGKFKLGSGEMWNTIPRIKDGNVVLAFGFGYREFHLKKDDYGKLFLVAQYKAKWKGKLRTYHILLQKL